MLDDMAWILPGQMQEGSMLLGLPAELRERIYKFALISDKPLVTFHIDEFQREVYEEACQPALLLVSHQVRNEALPLFYSCNDFIFFTEGKKADEACCWLDRVQPYLDIIGGAAFWFRHVNRRHSHLGPNGAISVTMHFKPRQARWIVSKEYRWISPVRKPDDTAADGEYLIDNLQTLLNDETRRMSIDLVTTLMNTLRKSYVDHKIH